MFIFAKTKPETMSKGIIFSIEEFAINDGPGIRTTVFLKGCPLRCAWCHNPEGLSFAPQVMHSHEGDRICGEEYTAQALAARLLKDREFFAMNDGGLTVTGGEPLAQPEFLIELLQLLKPVHRVIETSGYASDEVFQRVLPFVDLFLFDLKAMNSEIHKKYTGVDNAPILRNLATLCESGKPFIIRLPLIPGVNDTEEHMTLVREAIEGSPGLVRVEMLRYHKTAGAKYAMIDTHYDPPFDPDAEVRIHNVFKDTNIKTLLL